MATAEIQFREDTQAEWDNVDPILTISEPAYVSDTGGLKIGDGISAWGALPYVGGAWESYTPDWADVNESAGDEDDGSLTGSYLALNKTIFFKIKLTMGASATYPAAQWKFSLPPFSPSETATDDIVGNAWYVDGGSTRYVGYVTSHVDEADSIILYVNNSSATYTTATAVTSTVPFTWAAGDRLIITGIYEAL